VTGKSGIFLCFILPSLVAPTSGNKLEKNFFSSNITSNSSRLLQFAAASIEN
jgi:hypothetical protein